MDLFEEDSSTYTCQEVGFRFNIRAAPLEMNEGNFRNGKNPLRISTVVSPPISIQSERPQELTPAGSPLGGVFIADKTRRNLYWRSIISYVLT